MAYKQGENREQLSLEPMCLDDYVGADNICRVIMAFVKSLELSELGFKYAETKDNGRPPYDPASMLMLYLYGYLNRIRSSRRLHAETKRNLEVMWIMEKLTPDDKTICNFRKDNAVALKKVFRQFSLWCNSTGLYGKELVAVDGSKIRANANRNSIHTQKCTEIKLAEVEKKISEYMNELEKNDCAEAADSRPNAKRIAEILQHLNEKKNTLQGWLKRIDENDGKEISTVDSDAHMMHTNGDGRKRDACYNVQSVVDSKHNLIVDFDVTTCPDDKGALPKMTENAKEIMGVDKISATGDKGYYDGEDIEKCEQNGTTCYVPKVADTSKAPDEKYNKSKFKYDKENDCYICPENAVLSLVKTRTDAAGNIQHKEYRNTKSCNECPNRDKCTTSKTGRTVSRIPEQDTLDEMNSRMSTDEGRRIFRQRKKIVEHPFGTVKAVWGFRQFLCRGKEKTTAEMSLAFLAYNLRRVFSIFKDNGNDMVQMMR